MFLRDYKMKISSGNSLAPSRYQAIAWVKGDPGQWYIYASLELTELITSPCWEIYIDTERNGTVWAHEGYLHPHSWKWAIPTRQVGSGRGTGWPWFGKSPLELRLELYLDIGPSLVTYGSGKRMVTGTCAGSRMKTKNFKRRFLAHHKWQRRDIWCTSRPVISCYFVDRSVPYDAKERRVKFRRNKVSRFRPKYKLLGL